MATANDILKTAIAELGVKEYPAGTNKVKYNTWYYGKIVSGASYPWCMVFVQWVFNQAGAKSLLPAVTASCTALRDAAKSKGLWVTSGYQPGDLVIYDWGGDAKPDHVGIFEKWISSSTFYAIEGNTSVGDDSNGGEVMRRSRSTKNVLGAVRPKYTADTSTAPTVSSSVDAAKAIDESIAGSYKTTAALNLRSGAGTSKTVLVVIPKGATVTNYGYYTAVGSTKWLFVQYAASGKTYTGFASGQYLKKA